MQNKPRSLRIAVSLLTGIIGFVTSVVEIEQCIKLKDWRNFLRFGYPSLGERPCNNSKMISSQHPIQMTSKSLEEKLSFV